MKSRNPGVVFIIICIVGLVSFPILLDRLPGTKARWKLAQAANAVDLDNGDAEKLLLDAGSHLANPLAESDYWHVRVKLASKRSGADVVEVLKEAQLHYKTGTLGSFASVANVAIWDLNRARDYKAAMEASEILFASRKKPPNAIELNQLAYFRALSGEKLEQALKEINLALEVEKDDVHFLDTRAWVLYRLGLLPEALENADLAVKKIDRHLNEELSSFLSYLYLMFNGKPVPLAADGLLTQQEAGPLLWAAGVIHYHRGKILEGLGRTEQAQGDWEWLKSRQLPTDDRMQ